MNKSAFFNPLWSPHCLKHVMESFTIFTSSAILDHIIWYYFLQQDFAKWLGVTCNCIWGTVIAFALNKDTETKYCSCTKMFLCYPVNFTGSYTEDEPNFPRQNNLILQKKVSGGDKVVNFRDFSRPNKEIEDFSRTLTIF